MLKRYFVSYKYGSINGHEVVYAENRKDAISEFYKKCKHCKIEDNPKLELTEQAIDDRLLYSIDKSELLEIINKLLQK